TRLPGLEQRAWRHHGDLGGRPARRVITAEAYSVVTAFASRGAASYAILALAGWQRGVDLPSLTVDRAEVADACSHHGAARRLRDGRRSSGVGNTFGGLFRVT